MNFGKLLAASKNIFGGGTAVVYRRNKRVYLPKFNGENPFLPKLETPDAPEPKKAEVSPAAPRVAAPKMTVAAKGPVTTKAPMAPVAPVAAPRAVTQPMAPATAAPANWAEKWNPFRGAPAKAKAEANPVTHGEQTELSLNSVKVLHNDLTDADVEVVPVKSRTATNPANASAMAGLFNEQLLTTA